MSLVRVISGFLVTLQQVIHCLRAAGRQSGVEPPLPLKLQSNLIVPAFASLERSEEFPRVHHASPGVLIGGKHFLDNRREARVAADWIPDRVVFIKESDRSRG